MTGATAYLFALISERPGPIPRGGRGNDPTRIERKVDGFYVSADAAIKAAELCVKSDTSATYYVMKTVSITRNSAHTTRVEAE